MAAGFFDGVAVAINADGPAPLSRQVSRQERGRARSAPDIDHVAESLRFSLARLARLLRQQDQSGMAPALATALEQMQKFAPAGYTNWVSISKDGAKAAKAGDLAGAKASCRSCHDQYKNKYKTEMRDRKI